jgi:hypothetical protein
MDDFVGSLNMVRIQQDHDRVPMFYHTLCQVRGKYCLSIHGRIIGRACDHDTHERLPRLIAGFFGRFPGALDFLLQKSSPKQQDSQDEKDRASQNNVLDT